MNETQQQITIPKLKGISTSLEIIPIKQCDTANAVVSLHVDALEFFNYFRDNILKQAHELFPDENQLKQRENFLTQLVMSNVYVGQYFVDLIVKYISDNIIPGGLYTTQSHLDIYSEWGFPNVDILKDNLQLCATDKTRYEYDYIYRLTHYGIFEDCFNNYLRRNNPNIDITKPKNKKIVFSTNKCVPLCVASSVKTAETLGFCKSPVGLCIPDSLFDSLNIASSGLLSEVFNLIRDSGCICHTPKDHVWRCYNSSSPIPVFYDNAASHFIEGFACKDFNNGLNLKIPNPCVSLQRYYYATDGQHNDFQKPIPQLASWTIRMFNTYSCVSTKLILEGLRGATPIVFKLCLDDLVALRELDANGGLPEFARIKQPNYHNYRIADILEDASNSKRYQLFINKTNKQIKAINQNNKAQSIFSADLKYYLQTNMLWNTNWMSLFYKFVDAVNIRSDIRALDTKTVDLLDASGVTFEDLSSTYTNVEKCGKLIILLINLYMKKLLKEFAENPEEFIKTTLSGDGEYAVMLKEFLSEFNKLTDKNTLAKITELFKTLTLTKKDTKQENECKAKANTRKRS